MTGLNIIIRKGQESFFLSFSMIIFSFFICAEENEKSFKRFVTIYGKGGIN